MNQARDNIIIKALWDYDYVMAEITYMLADDLTNKQLRNVAQKITTWIKTDNLKMARDLLCCWSKTNININACEEKIEYLAKELKEGE